MLDLPDELLEIILLLLNAHEIFVLIRVSQRLRHLAPSTFLTHHGISNSQVESGTLALSQDTSAPHLLLIVIFSAIHAICKLEITPRATSSHDFLQRLATVLSIVPQIPDILIYNMDFALDTRLGMANIILASSKSPTTPLVLIKHGSLCVSHPRYVRPIPWRVFHHPSLPASFLSFFTFHLDRGLPRRLFGYLVGYLMSGIVNSIVLSSWIYHRVFGPRYSQDERIAADLPQVWYCMRIQSLSAGVVDRFTLVTSSSGVFEGRLAILNVRELTSSHYSSILSALALPYYSDLTLHEGCNVPLSTLIDFLQRHPNFTSLILRSESILHSSLLGLTEFIRHTAPSITDISIPATYVTQILYATPNVREISITFADSADTQSFDLSAWASISDAILFLPGTHRILLTLKFDVFPSPASASPWGADAVRMPLPRVYNLYIIARKDPDSALDKVGKALVRWVAACFPKLEFLHLRGFLGESRRLFFAQDIRDARGDAELAAWFREVWAEEEEDMSHSQGVN
ncbi:hypothetical protein B0H11DRAFT_1955576 [Mycena galericulata]|nr:hypothetical protein B0H11DRAFT_1955576 [Mycena galericulata]